MSRRTELCYVYWNFLCICPEGQSRNLFSPNVIWISILTVGEKGVTRHKGFCVGASEGYCLSWTLNCAVHLMENTNATNSTIIFLMCLCIQHSRSVDCCVQVSLFMFASLRPLHTSRFFVVEVQIFCRGQIGLKFVGPSACRTLADFLSRLNRVEAWSRIIQNQYGAFSTHVTLMTFPNWLSRARAPTNCPGPPHTSRHGPTRRFEI